MTGNMQEADAVSRIIMLTYGNMENGGHYWCYVAVKPSRIEEFKLATANRYNIQNFADDGFGEVIVSGEGVMPPKNITLEVAKMFKVPVKDFFKDLAPEKTIALKVQELKGERPQA
ncbi:MAG: hypothetical protein AB7L92_05160 [Alphaproteobacteria bacterium]